MIFWSKDVPKKRILICGFFCGCCVLLARVVIYICVCECVWRLSKNYVHFTFHCVNPLLWVCTKRLMLLYSATWLSPLSLSLNLSIYPFISFHTHARTATPSFLILFLPMMFLFCATRPCSLLPLHSAHHRPSTPSSVAQLRLSSVLCACSKTHTLSRRHQ